MTLFDTLPLRRAGATSLARLSAVLSTLVPGCAMAEGSPAGLLWPPFAEEDCLSRTTSTQTHHSNRHFGTLMGCIVSQH